MKQMSTAMFTLLMRCFEVSLFVRMRASGITTFFFTLLQPSVRDAWLSGCIMALISVGESSGLDHLGAGSCFQRQSRHLESLRLLTPSARPSLRPRAFCAGVELDMCAHLPGRIDRRCVSQLTPWSRDHYLFLRAAGNLCKVYARAWLDRGADTSRGTPCEPLNSAFRWAKEAHGEEELLASCRNVVLGSEFRANLVRQALRLALRK